MTRAEMERELTRLETEDARRDTMHWGHAVWIWERDKLIKWLDGAGSKPFKKGTPRPPMGPNSLRALARLEHVMQQTVHLIAVELIEQGYIVEQWPEYATGGRFWRCIVSTIDGRRHRVTARIKAGVFEYEGLPTRYAGPRDV